MRHGLSVSHRVLAVLLFSGLAGAMPALAADELFFSEYIEGSSNNKALEIFNGTGAAVNLATGGYNVQMNFNGSASAGLTINLTGTVADGDVYVLAQSSANSTILAHADQTNGAGWFNGDDAVVLRKGTTVIDVIGQVGFDPGTEWGTGFVSTADNTLRRKAGIAAGDPVGSDVFDPAVEWDGFATDTFAGLGCHGVGDAPPCVVSTTPVSGATNVSAGTSIAVLFSEPVNVSGSWFSISCAVSGVHAASVSGGPTAFTLDPALDFAFGESCTVTVLAAQVSDQDADDPPDTMAANFVFGFTTAAQAFGVCGDPATRIHAIQGDGLMSPLNGASAVIEGIVVGDYQGSGQFSGFHVQEEDANRDANPATSEGIFVFNTSFAVSAGDRVRVRGSVLEFATGGVFLTELTSVTDGLICSSGNVITSATVTLPINDLDDWEAFEGMLIEIPQDLTVTETFTLGRFGELGLSVGGRLLNPTMVVAPGAPANAQQSLNDRSRILLDDGNNQQNIDPTLYPSGGLSALNTLRSGYSVDGLTGVLEQRFGVYRVQPVGPVSFSPDNPRPGAPEAVGGRVRVSAMNVLNYFTTLGSGPNCGPLDLPCRGARDAFEFTRQRDKIVSAILGLEADVVGLMEIENNAAAAVQDLVDGLNAASASGDYAFIDTGAIGTDAIKVGLIYRADSVSPVGAHAILDSSVDPIFIDTLNRPVLAQTFEGTSTGERFTVAVNHLKSKGSDCNAVGDPDTGDGQGNCNVTRTNAAQALVNWLATDPTRSGDPDFLIVGDLNSYAMEDPITTIRNAGYTDLIDAFVGPGAYSFVFQGQSGYLDHALASPSLTAQATGATEWHVNADEPIVLDYNVEFKMPNHVNTLYNPGPYRSSDHDPLVVGLDLDQTPPTLNISVSPNLLWPPNHKYVTVNAAVSVSDNVDPDPTVTLLSVTSNEPDNAPGDADGQTTRDIRILGDFSFRLRAERSEIGTGRIYTITYQATDAHDNATVSSATVTVPLVLGPEG